MLRTIKDFICTCATTTQDKIQSVISMIGDYNTKRKAKKAEAKLQKYIQSFNLVITPSEVPDKLVVIRGEVYRIQFTKDSIEVTDKNGEGVENIITILEILKAIS